MIPSASMEETLLIGDHVLVDKLVYAPPGGALGSMLPYRDVRRGDIIVFRYPLNIQQDYVKRAIGVPGRPHQAGQQAAHAERAPGERAVRACTDAVRRSVSRQFSRRRRIVSLPPSALDMLQNHVENGEVVVPPGFVFAMGDNRDDSPTAATGASCRARTSSARR